MSREKIEAVRRKLEAAKDKLERQQALRAEEQSELDIMEGMIALMEEERSELHDRIKSIVTHTKGILTKLDIQDPETPPNLGHDKEIDLALVQTQLSSLRSLEQKLMSEIKGPFQLTTQKSLTALQDLLNKIDRLLIINEGFPREKIELLVNGSIVSNFASLLSFLNQYIDNYGFWKRNKTQRELFSAALTKKINELDGFSTNLVLGRLLQARATLEKYAAELGPKHDKIAELTEALKKLSGPYMVVEADVSASQSECLELEQEVARLEKELADAEALRLEQESTDLLAQQAEALRVEHQRQQAELVTALQNTLDSYQEDRDARYGTKDTFAKSDKNQRTQFIIELKQKLNEYGQSNDHAAVLDYINKNKSRFPGVHLQSTLNKVAITLLDFAEPQLRVAQESDKEISAILNAHKTTKNGLDYATRIEKLYQAIEDMRTFGVGLSNAHENQVITDLATRLTADVDYFVRQHETKLPNLKARQEFTARFETRLHSEDSLMSRYANRWLVILANIAAILTVIGAALLIHDKVKNRATTLFFSGTEKQKQAAKVESALNLTDGLEDDSAENGDSPAPAA